jgi:hypothetical protein
MKNKNPIDWLVSNISHGGLVTKKQFNDLVEQAKQMQIEQQKPYKEFCEWILVNKNSVFLDSDISKEYKAKIMNDLGYSSNSLD